MSTKINRLINNTICKVLIILLISIMACLPLFIHGIEGHFGQDLGFHLNRIEGIVTELKAGHFPVKMESNWMEGYGYPVAIYYGDLLLYIPALFRKLGMSVVSAYKSFVFLVTLATVITTYACFKKITSRTDIAYICSLIYTCAFYRIENVYIRGAVGEYCAMIFFPVVLYAIYVIYKSDKNIGVKKQFLNASLLTLGISGILNTHMLSLEIVGIVLIVFCLINFKKTFTKNVLITYLISGIEIVIVNLFFIVPFVDYYINENVNINNTIGNSRLIQDSGLYWWEYVSFFKVPFANLGNVGDDRLLVTPGIVCILVLIIGIIYWSMGKANREMRITIIGVCILLFICSRYFPWDMLAKSTMLGDFLAQVQFPWRYMGIVIMLLTLLASRILQNTDKKSVLMVMYAVIIVVTIVVNIWFTYEYKKYAELDTFETAEDLDSSDMGFIEYLRIGTEREKYTYTIETTSDINVEEIARNGTDGSYRIDSKSSEGEVTLPIVNYKGYELRDSNENKLEIYDGNNNLITFYVKSNYSDLLFLKFVQPVYWIIAEIISLVGALSLLVAVIIVRRKMEESK